MIRTSILLFLLMFYGCKQEKFNTAVKEEDRSENKKEINHTASFKGYITGISVRSTFVDVTADSIELLTGEKAEQVLAMDKKAGLTGTDIFGNGIYIRNIKKEKITFSLTPECKIIMQTYSRKESGEYNFSQKISSQQFTSFIETHPQVLNNTPFSFIIAEGKAKVITEIYLP